MITRTCKDCGETKPFERGHWRWSKEYGPHGMLCLACYRAMNKLAMRRHLTTEENKLKAHANHRRWCAKNPDKHASNDRAYQARKRGRSPLWASKAKIQAVYKQAVAATEAVGVKHVVDHIVPLFGSNVSGLHVEHNLQVLTHMANSAKQNRWDAEKSGFSFTELRNLFHTFDQQVKELS